MKIKNFNFIIFESIKDFAFITMKMKWKLESDVISINKDLHPAKKKNPQISKFSSS